MDSFYAVIYSHLINVPERIGRIDMGKGTKLQRTGYCPILELILTLHGTAKKVNNKNIKGVMLGKFYTRRTLREWHANERRL